MTAASIALPGHPDGPNNAERHRELILENFTPGRKRLSLMLTDDHHDYYKIPLGYDDTTAFNEDMSNPALKLVPVTFLRNIPDEGLGPLREGWVYIYVNGYLWREARYDTDCHMLIDVNLSYEKGLDRRRATVQKDSTLVLPWNMNGSESIVEIAFSEEQWSWERIDQLGGVDPEDPRQWLGERVESAYSTDYTAKARAARLMPVDLSAAESNFEDMPEGSNIRLVTNEELAPRRRHYNTKFDKGIASVILPDVIGDARYLASTQSDMIDLLDATVTTMLQADHQYPSGWTIDRIAEDRMEHIQTVADSRLAALFNTQFFAPIDQQLKQPDLTEKEREVLEQRVEDREELDLQAMEEQLNKEGCEQIIQSALDYRRDLIDLMDTPAFLTAMEDYHTLENAHWFLLPELMGQLIARFNQPVANAYKDLFFNLDDYALYLDRDQGADFLLRLTGGHQYKTPHPLADILFPQSGPDPENPLSISETEPGLEARLLNPVKIRRIIDGLNGEDHAHWPPITIDGTPVDMHEFVAQAIHTFTLALTMLPAPIETEDNGDASALIQSWRFSGHTAHAFGAKVKENAYEGVRTTQQMEQGLGESRSDRDSKQHRYDQLQLRHNNLKAQQTEQETILRQTEQYLEEARARKQELTLERQNILQNQSELGKQMESFSLVSRIDQIDKELIDLEQYMEEATAERAQLRQQRTQVTDALANIENNLNKMRASGTVLSGGTLKHNTKVVNLYSLLAGEHLQALKVTHDDLLNNRLPEGHVAMTAAGRMQRMKTTLATAKHIKNHQGPWVNFELGPDKKVRVPADLALENTQQLHQYLSTYMHSTLDTAEVRNANKIIQIVFAQEATSLARSAAEVKVIENANRLLLADVIQQAANDADQHIQRIGQDIYEYEQKTFKTKAEALELAKIMKDAETKITSLETTIVGYEKALTSGQPQLHFTQRMDQLFLLNGAMVAFEAYNLASVANRLMNDFGNTRARIDMASALTDFAATIATSYQYVFESKYGTTKQIESRLKDAAKRKFIQTLPVDGKILGKSILVTRIAAGTNIVAGVLSALLSSIDAYNRWMLGDRDAAIAYGMTVVGFALTAIAAIPAMQAAALALNIVGFVLIAAGFALVYFLIDTPTETLLKNSPFGKDPDLRFGGGLIFKDEDYQHWKNRRDLAYHECTSFFLQPSVHFAETWVEHEEYCELAIQTPGLMTDGVYQIDIQAWHIKEDRWETITLLSNDPSAKVSANPGNVQIAANGSTYKIRVHRDLIKTFGAPLSGGFGYISTETNIRVRVQTYPKGEAARIFPGALTPYVLPAPKRDELGRATIDGEVVDEKTAAENSWLIAEGAVVHSFKIIASPT